jgi:ADP-heptose:LPS heptosyltransferase
MMSESSLSSPARIGVIVGRDLIGDGLIKMPFVRALRNAFPKASIRWITSLDTTCFAGPLREATRGLIDNVDEMPPWITGKTGAPAPFFDLLLDTRNRWKLALQARKYVPHKTFIAMAAHYLFSDRRPFLLQPAPKHIVDRLLQMVELAAGYQPPCVGSLPVPENLLQRARHILPESSTYVGLAPGAGNPVKIWPRYKFEKVAASQAAKGRVPVFLLGPQELDWYNELATNVPAAKFPLQDYDAWGTAQLTIDHTFAIAKCLSVAVANDSGVGNMLGAMDCKLISLFGPTSADKLTPRVSRGQVIRAQDFGGSPHMNAILWERVDAAVDGMLSA